MKQSRHRYTCMELSLLVIAAANCAAFTHSPMRTTPTHLQTNNIRHDVPRFMPIVANHNEEHLKRTMCHHRQALVMHSSAASDDTDETEKMRYYIRPYLKQLFLLCRPSNFPVVSLFHVLGVHQAVQLWESSTSGAVVASASSSPLLMPLLKHPSMLMVLLTLLLVTSTSMITNDYYDARNGVDAVVESNDSNADGNNGNEHYHPIANGEVPFSVTKTFDSYLYAILLISSAFVPGVISRLFVLGGAIITYLYTVHLKPKTWIKNLSCAALVAMSPVTSGLAAWHVLCEESFLKSLGAAGSSAIMAGSATVTGTIPFHLIFTSPLSFLVVSLFAGIMSREILMDITDIEGDANAGIETLPVKYGKGTAASVALGCSIISAISACGASLIPLLTHGAVSVSSISSLLTDTQLRKVLLSVLGSGLLLLRTFNVWKTKGEDANLAERAISESLISVLLVLASFL